MKGNDENGRRVETLLVENSNHVFPNHAHDGYYVVGCMLRGASYCFDPRRARAVVNEGEYCAFNPSQVHSGVPVGGIRTTYRMIYIPEELMNRALWECREDAGTDAEFQSPVAQVADGVNLIERIYAESKRDAASLGAEVALLEFVGAMDGAAGFLARSRRGADPAALLRGHPALRRAADFLAGEPERRIGLDELAREAGLSKYHLVRSFKKAYGVPPHVYRTQARVEYAKTLISRGRPFAEAALEAGFSDQSHFQRSFKAYVGLTPGRFAAGA